MTIVSLYDGHTFAVTDEVAKWLDEQWAKPNPERKLFVPGADTPGGTLALSNISGIWPEETWEMMQRHKAGEWRCANGHWHPKSESSCGIRPAEPVQAKREQVVDHPMLEWQWEALRLNKDRLDKFGGPHKQVGVLKTQAEYEHFKATGEWPEYVDPRTWHEVLGIGQPYPKGNDVRSAWVKLRVPNRQWEREYAGRPGYRKLTEEGSDVWVAFMRPIRSEEMVGVFGGGLPQHLDFCDPSEVAYLERTAVVG